VNKYLAIALAMLTLSACAAKTELQQDQTGSDKMLLSPCACEQLDYHPKVSFKWRAA
jgi:hypothetical protein